MSNEDWQSPTDPDSRIAKMKDGTTHLAYKAEHVVDLGSDLLLSATITPANYSDAETLCDSLSQAQLNLQAAGSVAEIEEAAIERATRTTAKPVEHRDVACFIVGTHLDEGIGTDHLFPRIAEASSEDETRPA